MQLIHQVSELRAQIAAWRRAGLTVALTPTMGNLHAGHLRLVEHGRRHADRVVATVFVNPLQFGPNEDFDRYPRTLAADAEKLSAAGCDLLFAPSVEEMYPQGRAQLTTVSVPHYDSMLEGAFRPGHFDGVATVVNILFNLVQPDVALFGEKDYQQFLVIRKMVADLRLPLRLIAVPTEREADGLAMSSRNQYLQPQERHLAVRLYAALQAVAAALRAGRRDYAALEREQVDRLQAQGFMVDYLCVRQPTLMEPDGDTRQWRVLVAARIGATRLIDNIGVESGGNGA